MNDYTLSFRAVERDTLIVDAIRFDGAEADCPPAFRDIARVIGPAGSNPAIQIMRPLGSGMVQQILDLIAAAGNDEIDAERALAARARDLLLLVAKSHGERCRDPECRMVADLLAFLAHCLGATEQDLRALPQYLVKYDLACEHSGECDTHKLLNPPRKGAQGC